MLRCICSSSSGGKAIQQRRAKLFLCAAPGRYHRLRGATQAQVGGFAVVQLVFPPQAAAGFQIFDCRRHLRFC